MAENNKKSINPKLYQFVKGLFFVLLSIFLTLNVGKVARTLNFLPIYLFGSSCYALYVLLFSYGFAEMTMLKKKKNKFVTFIVCLLMFISAFFFVSVYPCNFANPNPIATLNKELSTYYRDGFLNICAGGTYFQNGVLGIVFAYLIKNRSVSILIGAAFALIVLIIVFAPIVVYLIKKHKVQKKEKPKDKIVVKLPEEEAPAATPIKEENPILKEPESYNLQPGFENDKEPFINENSGFSRPAVSLDESFAVSHNRQTNNEFTPLVFSNSRNRLVDNTPISAPTPTPVEEVAAPSEPINKQSDIDDSLDDYFVEENIIEARPEVIAPTPVMEKRPLDESLVRAQPIYVDPNEVHNPIPEALNQPITPTPAPVVEAPKKKVRVNWVPPSSEILMTYPTEEARERNEAVANERVEAINSILANFKVGAYCNGYKIGPSVTRFNIEYEPNVTVKSVERLTSDISMRLGGLSTRFTAIVPNEPYSGLEVPNEMSTTVGFKEVFDALPDVKKHPLAVAFGKDISGNVISADFNDFPHLLVAGTTGSGKSIFIHSIIDTLIMRVSPDDLKLVLVDPKKVEMTKYRDMPHLLCPIITEADKCKVLLQKLVVEMNDRYDKFARDPEISNIKQYNEWAKEHDEELMPYIIAVIDEYADLVDNCKELSQPVVSIAQKARACGIHMLISTQRPSTNVITGTIKGNIPTHVALLTSNYTDSMIIIGEGGAETLQGRGDMLVQSPLISRTGVVRLQGCFVQNKEISHIVAYLKEHYQTVYEDKYLDLVDHSKEVANNMIASGAVQKEADDAEEEKYQSIKEWVMTQKFVSMSKIQRECSVGFNRAGRYFKRLQQEGVVSYEVDGTSKGCAVLTNDFSDDNSGGTIVTSDEVIY